MLKNFKQNKKLICILLVVLILFCRCNLGIVYCKAFMLLNVFIDFVAIVYVAGLEYQKIRETGIKSWLKLVFNPAIIWLLAFSILVFIYGHFKLFVCSDFYSRQFAILTVLPAVLIFALLRNNEEAMLEIVAKSGGIVVVTTFITGILYDSCYTEWFEGTFARVGKTPAGTSVDSANLYLILLVPIMYYVLVKKKLRGYLPVLAIGILGIMLTGSKACMIPVVFVFAIMLLGSSADKKTLLKSLGILAGFLVVAIILCLNVPLFYNIVGDRFIEFFTTYNDTNFDLHTSTGQRMAVVAAFKEHFGESPVFGHGFYSFLAMPYSQLEEYKVDGVAMYRNIQIHMNYLEVLFSYGIVGFVLYYWFPVKLVIDSVREKIKGTKLICFSYLVAMAFIDLGLDMYYKYLIPYFTYLVVYSFLTSKSKDELR